ncbi:DUF2333 family protein [uncultured Thiohalocapsa sp.]|uniref:DUF2333 family protein n=1 Tax=uncultured Thiohalocapsa sp. TaxID=768990 RepID=UPI0025E1AA51|nr:DUF2333 family protein [uncultured Thiohalocapsa sp.]
MARGPLSDVDRILRADERAPAAAESQPDDAAEPQTKAAAGAGAPGGALRWGSIAIALIIVGIVGLGTWWSFQPAKFDVQETMQARIGADASPVPGAAIVATAIQVADTLLHKPGGYLNNDMTPPGVIMDNMPSWEYGVLTELRDSVRALRNDFSRSQTQSIENEDLKKADSEFNFDAEAWFLPSAEQEYEQGIMALQRYLDGLIAGSRQASFYVRADNLASYLQVVEKRLGSYGQRLSASVGDAELTAALSGAGVDRESQDGQAAAPAAGATARTPWTEIDDVFFEARGYSWALLHMMKAIATDFAPVLQAKNAEVSIQQIIRDLEYATVRKWSPVVLNGHGFGVLANHSLVLASYMSRANAAVLDLRVLMERG